MRPDIAAPRNCDRDLLLAKDDVGAVSSQLELALLTFRLDTWTPDGESIVEHVASIEDYQLALATFRAACERWPGIPITLRQGARVIEDSRQTRTASWSNKGSREGGR